MVSAFVSHHFDGADCRLVYQSYKCPLGPCSVARTGTTLLAEFDLLKIRGGDQARHVA